MKFYKVNYIFVCYDYNKLCINVKLFDGFLKELALTHFDAALYTTMNQRKKRKIMLKRYFPTLFLLMMS